LPPPTQPSFATYLYPSSPRHHNLLVHSTLSPHYIIAPGMAGAAFLVAMLCNMFSLD
jgi:hypothetical protein